MKLRIYSLVAGVLLSALSLMAGTPVFEDFFLEKTLRIDYIFAANDGQQAIYVDQLHSYDYWAGRRHNLDFVPVAGNGSLTVKDLATGQVIYMTSFSSLFCEAEALNPPSNGSFEHVINLPFPKAKAEISIALRDKYHKETASTTFVFDPSDILIHGHSSDEPVPYKYILKSGDYKDKIDVAIMAEGYTEAEMDVFYKDAEATVEALLTHKAFARYRDRFNFIAVACPSKDSGVSEPLIGKWKRTAVGSNYSTFYSDRYLTTKRVFQVNDVLSGIPFEHIIILANTNTYGGGGIYNSYTLTTAHNHHFKPVVVHEFGHSFGALADEYAYSEEPSDTYPYEIEPWERNITTKVNFSSKWQDLIDQGVQDVGLVEGAGYTLKGIYRGSKKCRMLDNTSKDFCPVCTRAIEDMIRYYTE